MRISNRLLNILVPITLVLASFFWKLAFINHRDICLDEPFSLFHAQQGISHFFDLLEQGPDLPLFFLILHFWTKIFGNDPESVRLIPLIFNAFTTLFIYIAGKRFFGFITGLMAAVIFILSKFHFFQALEVRTYSLFILATSASLYYFLLYKDDPKSKKSLVWLIFWNIILVHSHYFGWFVIFMQSFTGIFYSKGIRSFWRIQLPVFASILSYIPLLPYFISQFSRSKQGTWVQPPGNWEYLDYLYHFLNHKEGFTTTVYVSLAGIAVASYFIFYKKASVAFNKNLLIVFIWWFIPYTVMFLVSSGIPMFIVKYTLFNTIGYYIFIAALIGFICQFNRYTQFAGSFIIIAYIAIHISILPKDYCYREVKNSVGFVKKHQPETDERIILIYPAWADLGFAYYYDRNWFNQPDSFKKYSTRNNIFPVHNLSNAREVIRQHPGKRVIMFKDTHSNNEDERFFEYLSTSFTEVARDSFPQSFIVGVYDPALVQTAIK